MPRFDVARAVEDLAGWDGATPGDFFVPEALTGVVVLAVFVVDPLPGDFTEGAFSATCFLATCFLAGCLAGDCLAGDCLAGDCVAGDCLADDCLAVDCLAGDCLAGDCLAGDCLAGDCVAGGCLAGDCLATDCFGPAERAFAAEVLAGAGGAVTVAPAPSSDARRARFAGAFLAPATLDGAFASPAVSVAVTAFVRGPPRFVAGLLGWAPSVAMGSGTRPGFAACFDALAPAAAVLRGLRTAEARPCPTSISRGGSPPEGSWPLSPRWISASMVSAVGVPAGRAKPGKANSIPRLIASNAWTTNDRLSDLRKTSRAERGGTSPMADNGK